jgi:hypothetical protein
MGIGLDGSSMDPLLKLRTAKPPNTVKFVAVRQGSWLGFEAFLELIEHMER